MPKAVDYPRAGLDRCLELARAVHELGGDCTLAAAAQRLGARPGGTFHAIVSAAGRYGFVTARRGRLRTEAAFRAYRLAYDAAERERALAGALGNVPLFRRLLERFAGRPLPEGHLDRMLVREYAVAEASGERVAGYFRDAVRAAGLLNGGVLAAHAAPGGDGPARPARGTPPPAVNADAAPAASRESFRVQVSGPGVESYLEIADAADVELLRALFAKLERAIRDRA